jgi:small subunit ribosomal protein S1
MSQDDPPNTPSDSVELGSDSSFHPAATADATEFVAPPGPDVSESSPAIMAPSQGLAESSADFETSASSGVAQDVTGESEDEAFDDSQQSGEESSDDSLPPGDASDADAAKKKKRRRKKRRPTAGAEGASEPPTRPSQRAHAHERVPFRVGEQVFGKVTAVLDEAIMIDLSGKALGIFDRAEMAPDDLVPQVADSFVAEVHNDGGRGGCVVLSRKRLREEEIKPEVEKACLEGTLVKGLVTGTIKGGIEVDIFGLRAFAPASGMDLHPANANFASLVGQRLDFKVIQFEKSGRDVVVTRRPMLEAEAHERRKHALTLLSEGQVLDGVVRTVVDWGLFVALPEAENLEGLVHASEASHDPRPRLVDLFKPGEHIQVQITKIDDKGKIWLSRRALVDDPWSLAREKYAPLSRHQGTVTSIENFGVFIELEPGIEGLMHVADISFDPIEHPSEKLKEGDKLDVIVAHMDGRNRKIALHPAPSAEQANEAPQKIVRNSTVKVEVMKIESSGLVVRLLGATGRAARGYIPAGQTGTPRGSELRKSFKLGGRIDAKIVDLDPRRGEPKLSIRGLAEDEERRAAKEYRQKVKAESSFGTLGDLFKNKFASVPPATDSESNKSSGSD